MTDLLFSLNIVLPVFVIILFGFLMKRMGIISEGFLSSATSIVYYFALPARLFLDVSKSDFVSLMNTRFVLFILGATVLFFIATWIVAVVFIKDKSKISAYVQSVFRGNYVYIGLPITQNILQIEVIPSTILVIAFVLPLYNILAVIILSYYCGQKEKVSNKNQLFSILKNPMIIAIAVALPFSLLQVKFPFALSRSLDYLGILATPMALLLVGAGMEFHTLIRNRKLIITASILKVILQPIIFVPIAVFLGFSTQEVVTVYVLFAVPTALNAYIMTKKLGGDGDLSAGIIVCTVILSVLTIPLGAYLLTLFGII